MGEAYPALAGCAIRILARWRPRGKSSRGPWRRARRSCWRWSRRPAGMGFIPARVRSLHDSPGSSASSIDLTVGDRGGERRLGRPRGGSTVPWPSSASDRAVAGRARRRSLARRAGNRVHRLSQRDRADGLAVLGLAGQAGSRPRSCWTAPRSMPRAAARSATGRAARPEGSVLDRRAAGRRRGDPRRPPGGRARGWRAGRGTGRRAAPLGGGTQPHRHHLCIGPCATCWGSGPSRRAAGSGRRGCASTSRRHPPRRRPQPRGG